ncbi:MAG: class I SAM-dependent methyltransferase [Labilithrix sp.]|nr:class I SAM-dependent methyltransferase [Labilithrix sp.]
MTRSSFPPPRGEIATSPARHLGHEEAAIFETFVVPRYLSFFGERLVGMLAGGRDARVCHVQCRTGYPDRLLVERLPNVHVHGSDASPYAIELARAKAAALVKGDASVAFDYRVTDALPLAYPGGAFSHAFTIHPLAAPAERRLLLEELARIVAPRGQALIAMPLRGSFVEIADLLRECALKHELVDLTNAVEAAMQLRPTGELLEQELEAVGFEYVDVDVRTRTLEFAGGRGFFEDPVTRLLLMPEFRVNLALDAAPDAAGAQVDPFDYVRDAIDKYWSDRTFAMTVNVGVVSGRRR